MKSFTSKKFDFGILASTLCVGLHFFTMDSLAQSDPNTNALLQSTKSENSSFTSRRYEVRKTTKRTPQLKQDQNKVGDRNAIDQKGNTINGEKNPDNGLGESLGQSGSQPSVKQPGPASATEPVVVDINTTPDDENIESPAVADQIQSLLFGNGDGGVSEYQRQIHEDDPRLNRVEFLFAPTLIYNDSTSNSWYRKYSSLSQGLDFGVALWLTPFIGITGEYLTSLSGDVVSNYNSLNRAPMSQEWFDFGLRHRRYFGLSRKSPSIEFGLNFSEYNFKVPSDSTNRTKIQTTGLTFDVQLKMPTSARNTSTLGFSISPRHSHKEIATGWELISGEGVETNRIGLGFGGEIRLSRKSQLIWSFDLKFEKNLFSGTSNTPEPDSSPAVKGVSVNNTFSILRLGYKWGD